MARNRRNLSLNWIRALISRDRDDSAGARRVGISHIFRFVLVASVAVIVSLSWFLIDRNESYRVGSPSPRTYLAQSSARFVDRTATSEMRNQAADQIVNVRVRNERMTQVVRERISALKESGELDFAPPQVLEVLNGVSDDVRSQIIAAVIDVAERNYDKSINWTEQTGVIWDSLRPVDMPQADKNIAFQILDSMLAPTVTEDPEMTGRLRDEVSQRIPSVVREIRLGGVVVQQGQTVTPAIAEVLRNQGYPDAALPWKHMVFIIIVTFAWSHWLSWLSGRLDSPLSGKEWIYVAVILLIDWSTQRWLARWDIDSLSLLVLTGWLFMTVPTTFAFHVALGGGLIGYLIAFPGMTSTIAVGCIVCGVASGASILYMRDTSSRIMIWRNIFSLGLCLTFTSLFVRWGLGLALSWEMLGTYLVLSAFWSSLVVAVLPLWESVFEIISPLRLLEMSHPSQPLLKRLQLEAPGTYHHTITVGTMAEAVADKLGMNGLLVRTGANYHDIGKLKRPHYFVENQSFGDNIHDRLAPQDSARIILSHVADGLRLADEYKLPGGIKNFISEHHGKTCLGYFYNKAVAADREAGGDGQRIDRDEYCYPGPIPQRRETALLMLADSIEAALKGLKNPLAGRPELEKMVGDVIDSKIIARQFIDVDFTLRDLSAIKTAFVEVLMSMYHTREVKPIASSDGERPEDAARKTDAGDAGTGTPDEADTGKPEDGERGVPAGSAAATQGAGGGVDP
ncbi:MAG: HDIG domain-containing protein [Synergistaceae bacterium]|jgi:putative nucleotidyltransferase with HDIG domain|nr:HDIG domain-containing protein [Synergistaceae bacterium]